MAKSTPEGRSWYPGPTPKGASLVVFWNDNATRWARAPAGTRRVRRPSVERIEPPSGPIVALDGMAVSSGAIGVNTESPDALSIEES